MRSPSFACEKFAGRTIEKEGVIGYVLFARSCENGYLWILFVFNKIGDFNVVFSPSMPEIITLLMFIFMCTFPLETEMKNVTISILVNLKDNFFHHKTFKGRIF